MIEAFSFFDQIYCINSDKRTDRWEQVSKEFEKVQISSLVQRVSAIIIKDDPALGCLKSHQQIIDSAIKEGKERILIFEDDVQFLSFDHLRFTQAIKELKSIKDWELFYLGGRAVSRTKKLSKNVVSGKFFSTHAYAVNLNQIKRLPALTTPIDRSYAAQLKSLAIFPIIAVQRTSYSDITLNTVSWKKNDFIMSMYLSRFMPSVFMEILPIFLRGNKKKIPSKIWSIIKGR